MTWEKPLLCVRIIAPERFRSLRCGSITCGCRTACVAARCDLDRNDPEVILSQAQTRCYDRKGLFRGTYKKDIMGAKVQARLVHQQCNGLRVHPHQQGTLRVAADTDYIIITTDHLGTKSL